MSRAYRTHWAPHQLPPRRPRFTICGRSSVGEFGGPCYAEYDPQYVDCRVCLYHMGRYMPLLKLHEHQNYNRLQYNFQQEFFKPQPLVGL